MSSKITKIELLKTGAPKPSALYTVLIVVMVAGCSSLQPIPDELYESAYACMQHYSPQGDPLRRSSGEPAPESSFLTINRSESALEWRRSLADKSQQTLDIQYFLWRTDDTGALLISHILAAADRGVRVRLLFDDLGSVAWNRQAVILNSHPDIDIRVFNPFKTFRGGRAQRAFELLLDINRLNHRMHNKLFMVDQRIAIVGGRNIGNEYFGSGSPLDYRDYDLIAIGPVVEEITESFETFWNSDWAYPLENLPAGESTQTLDGLRKELTEQIHRSDVLASDYLVELREWSALIATAQSRLSKGRSRAVFDCPPNYHERQFPVQTAYTLNRVANRTKNEIVIISPYVVPLAQLREAIRNKVAAGVDITIYTNSLASSDHTLAFSGYARHRTELLRMGVSIRELKPDAAFSSEHQLATSPADYLSMHAKLVIFDRRWVYVGSLNLDPRSAHWNTELGLLIDSTELAEKVLRDFAGDFEDTNSWKLALADDQNGRARMRWLSGDTESKKEGSRGIGQIISLWFYSLLPLDEQL